VRQRDGAMPWPAGEADPAGGDATYRRLGVLIMVVERTELAHDAVRTALEDALCNGDALALFAEAGIPEHRGIVQEALERVQNLVLPAPRDEHDLGRLVARVLPDARAARWLEAAPPAPSENRLVWPLGGVALMFFLNLGVSFALALWVASRARGVGLAGGRAILRAILRRLVRHPLEFLWPPRVESGPAPTPGH